MKLTAELVEQTFMECLFKEHEPGEELADDGFAVTASGIMNTFGFHPGRLEESREVIVDLLNELPEFFHQDTGGGWSFLNACEDRHGVQWTGLHQTMDMLFVLGMAIGRVKCVLPREMWPALPGGMPYYVVLREEHHE